MEGRGGGGGRGTGQMKVGNFGRTIFGGALFQSSS